VTLEKKTHLLGVPKSRMIYHFIISPWLKILFPTN
jgi:hypothetical protein